MFPRMKAALIAPALVIVTSLGASADDSWKPLAQEVEQYGYYLHKPPRSDRGPGFVYTKFKDATGRKQVAPVCDTFNKNLKLADGDLFLAVTDGSKESDLNFGLGLLKGIVSSITGAQANLERKKIKTINIQFGSVNELIIPEPEVPNGTPQEVSRECQNNVKKLVGDNGKIKKGYELWFVQKALRSDSLVYNFDTKQNLSANADLNGIKNAIDFKAGVKTGSATHAKLHIDLPNEEMFYIAYVHRPIRIWEPVNFVSPGEHAKIQLESTPTTDPLADIEGGEVTLDEALTVATP